MAARAAPLGRPAPASKSSAATRPRGWLSSRSASATVARYLHHNFVVALLNDLFGIQARGGCSCAGPYGHRLLAIGPARSHALREEIGHGCDGVKPGWTRVNLNYFISRRHGRLHRRRGRADRRRRVPAAAGLPVRPAYRPVAARRRAAPAADHPGRRRLRPGRRDGPTPGAAARPARTPSPATWRRPAPSWPPGPPAFVRDPPGCHPTSRPCAGSRCPRPACRAGRLARPSPADVPLPPGPLSVLSGLPSGLAARRAAPYRDERDLEAGRPNSGAGRRESYITRRHTRTEWADEGHCDPN